MLTIPQYLCLGLVSLLLPSLHAESMSTCDATDSVQVRVEVNSDKIERSQVPKALFGFNVPWKEFQLGYFQDGKVRRDVIDYLKPFSGALYRYPGGTPSNWFDWQIAMKPAALRSPVHSDFKIYATPHFGVAEFLTFLSEVNGRGMLTLNLVGPYLQPQEADVITRDAIAIADYLKQSSIQCVSGNQCPIAYWELGNELDWKPINWTAQQYIARSNAVVAGVNKVYPGIDWIANGMTAPWEKKLFNKSNFDEDIVKGLTPLVKNVALHPYYDGIPIPKAQEYIHQLHQRWVKKMPDAKVMITEHARWPSEPLIGKWEDNWYQATGLGGAISSADFMLAIMADPAVGSANWHALGVEGPWQLLRLNVANKSIYPSPVYWALRTLREAMLDNVVNVQYDAQVDGQYRGGYDLRFIAMTSNALSRRSILGVNRSKKSLKVAFSWQGAHRLIGKNSQLTWVSSQSEEDDNTDKTPNKVLMRHALRTKTDKAYICIPPQSVFSLLESND